MWILPDSTVWLDYFRGTATPQTDFLDRALGWRLLGIGELIYTEVLAACPDERDRERAEIALNRFRRVNMVTFEIARRAARNSCILRAKGLPAPGTLETLIATFAIETGWVLLHDRPAYAPFEEHLGLKVVEVGG